MSDGGEGRRVGWTFPFPCRINYRQRNYAEVSTQLHGAIGVVEEFSKYQGIPQIKQLMDRWVGLWVELWVGLWVWL